MTEKDPTEPERRAELANFLRAHRTRILPTQLGIPARVQRRTPRLCDDVAALIGVGVTRYTGLAAFSDRLQQVSPEFCTWWSQHEVQQRERAIVMQHPRVGRLVLEYIAFVVEASPSLSLRVFLPLPDADTAVKLQRLWAEPGCPHHSWDPRPKPHRQRLGCTTAAGASGGEGSRRRSRNPFASAFNGRGLYEC